MIGFIDSELLLLLLLLPIFLLINKKVKSYENYFSKEMLEKLVIGKSVNRLKHIFMIVSSVFLVIAIARPVIYNEPIVVKKDSLNMIVALDISKSMWCEDIYPNRLEFSKNKFDDLLSTVSGEKIGVVGFSSRSFLISPLTDDYGALKYLVRNLTQDTVNVQGSNVLNVLHTTKDLLKDTKDRSILIFTDGTDVNDFSKSISYARKHNIKVFIYATATKQGGVIKLSKDRLQKDQDGNIVVTSLNSNIKELALKSGGAYLEFSSATNDMKALLNEIRSATVTNNKVESKINQDLEIFYLPLFLSIIFYFLSIFGFKRGGI